MARNFSKFINRPQTTDPGNTENRKQYKYQNICTQAYHSQTAENQKQKKTKKS